MPSHLAHNLNRYPTRLAASTALAAQTATSLQNVIQEHGHASVALTGRAQCAKNGLASAGSSECEREKLFAFGEVRSRDRYRVLLNVRMLDYSRAETSTLHCRRKK